MTRPILALALVGELLLTACGNSRVDPSGSASPNEPGATSTSAVPPPPPSPTAPASEGGAPASGPLVPAVRSCGVTTPACGPGALVTDRFATYRKDAYLPDSAYLEQGAAPLAGGRVHIAGIASASGAVTAVRIGGVLVDDLLTQGALDWYHVWPRTAVAGRPIWVAFHSRSASWDTKTTETVTVETATGTALDGAFAVRKAPVPLRYVTTSDGGKTLIVHAQNTDTVPHTIARLLVDGQDVTSVACIPDKTLAPGAHVLVTLPRCVAEQPGAAWTVVLELTDGAPATGVGRVLKEQFPLEAWQNKEDCVLPGGGNPSAFAEHQAAGIDTLYMYFANPGCGLKARDLVNTTLPALPKKTSVLVGDDFLRTSSPETAITDTSAVAGFLTGDESDGEYLVDGYPAAELKAQKSRRLWSMYPSLTTYNGGKTNKKIGAFAGMADVQGMDFYVAGCAPHITQAGVPVPLRGAYDYLRNTRENHAPLPTWLYAQGLHDGWNKSVLGQTVHVQPDAAEITVQAVSVAAAGGKGLMWFQTDMTEAALTPDRWDALARATLTTRAVRAWLREGDPTGLATGPASVIVEAIRARDAIVVPIVSLATSSTPDDVACAKIYVGSPVPHFAFATQTVPVSVRVPDDFAVDDVFEVAGGAVKAAPSYAVSGRAITFDVTLGQAEPARVLVLARDKSARASVPPPP